MLRSGGEVESEKQNGAKLRRMRGRRCLEQHVRVCPGGKLLACFGAAWSLSVPTEGTVGFFGEYIPFVFNKDDL